jgi:hypothetical protein
MESVDADMDGRVSVDELRSWVRAQARRSDIESHEKSLTDAQRQREKEDKVKAEAADKAKLAASVTATATQPSADAAVAAFLSDASAAAAAKPSQPPVVSDVNPPNKLE